MQHLLLPLIWWKWPLNIANKGVACRQSAKRHFLDQASHASSSCIVSCYPVKESLLLHVGVKEIGGVRAYTDKVIKLCAICYVRLTVLPLFGAAEHISHRI